MAFKLIHLSEQLGRDSITIRKHELLHSMKCVYYPVITFTHYEWQDTLATIFMQALPCFFMDFFHNEKIRLLAVSRKIKSMKNVIHFFMTKRIFFDSTNTTREVHDRWVYFIADSLLYCSKWSWLTQFVIAIAFRNV